MKKITILSFFAALILMLSCQDDMNINADWESIPVIYCLLNQNETIHYVKVNKAFLGEASAAEMAQVSDSLFYDYVEVWIDEVTRTNGNDVINRKLEFVAVDNIDKPEGYFANDRNTLYAYEGELSTEYVYLLNVNIPSANITCKSEVELVDGATITKPVLNHPIILTNWSNGSVEMKYRTGNNGSIYQMVFDFYYIEVDESTGDTTRNIDPIRIEMSKDDNDSEGVEVKKEFTVEQFYQLIKDNIPVKEGVKRLVRYPESVKFTLYVADENFKIYSEVSEPSSSIVQEKPFFTNIDVVNNDDGLAVGLFAARFNYTVINKMTAPSLDSLSRGVFTKDLNFVTKDDHYYD
jgi:hypothetical protein